MQYENKDSMYSLCRGSGNGTEETLKAFDILNHFLKTEMCGRIPCYKE